MRIYIFLSNSPREIYEVLNRVHIYFRAKQGFKSFFYPLEIFIEGGNTGYEDVIEYTTASNSSLSMGFLDASSGASLIDVFHSFLINLKGKEVYTPDLCLIGGLNYYHEDWIEYQQQILVLESVKITGDWSKYYIENIQTSVLTDMYKNIFIGQIQKDFR